jgi:hypothetical protein
MNYPHAITLSFLCILLFWVSARSRDKTPSLVLVSTAVVISLPAVLYYFPPEYICNFYPFVLLLLNINLWFFMKSNDTIHWLDILIKIDLLVNIFIMGGICIALCFDTLMGNPIFPLDLPSVHWYLQVLVLVCCFISHNNLFPDY